MAALALGRLLLRDHRRLPVTVTVAATRNGQTVTKTMTVVLHGHRARLRVTKITLNRDGSAVVRVHVNVPGRVLLLISAWKHGLAGAASYPLPPGAGRFVVGRASRIAGKQGTFTLHLTASQRGRQLLAHATSLTTYRVWVSYRPRYATQQNAGFYALHLGSALSGRNIKATFHRP